MFGNWVVVETQKRKILLWGQWDFSILEKNRGRERNQTIGIKKATRCRAPTGFMGV